MESQSGELGIGIREKMHRKIIFSLSFDFSPCTLIIDTGHNNIIFGY